MRTCIFLVSSGQGVTVQPGYFGEGYGLVWLEQLHCTGNETRLLDCDRGNSNFDFSNCRHSQDVSVICPGIYMCLDHSYPKYCKFSGA